MHYSILKPETHNSSPKTFNLPDEKVKNVAAIIYQLVLFYPKAGLTKENINAELRKELQQPALLWYQGL